MTDSIRVQAPEKGARDDFGDQLLRADAAMRERDPGEITKALSHVEDRVERVAHLVSQLAGRLSPVLTHFPQPDSEKRGPIQETGTELGERLARVGRQLDDVGEALVDLQSRCEI